ncbi:hypothetical protein ABSL23_11010 [Halobacterium sp. NMX12-1]|uniref:Halobacterial output domain-containing protein n=1 Tax=Halobacterium sp. NMX12-1 TaxID=3166650 RepID=A0AAU8CAN8_9EURY
MRDDLPSPPEGDDGASVSADRQRPPLRANVHVLAGPNWCSKIRTVVPDEITVRTFTDADSFDDALTANVAVALLSCAESTNRLQATVRRTVAASPHAHVGLLATDETRDADVPRDVEFVAPVDREAFAERVKRLYVRAHYAATLDRYYRVSVTIRNLELRTDEAAVDDAELDRLRAVRDRSRRYLRQFRAYLDAESLAALKSRGDRLEALVADARTPPDPAARGLPESCPACSFDWTTWHGRGLGAGYRKLGSDTWQCTNCGETLAGATPSSYRVN